MKYIHIDDTRSQAPTDILELEHISLRPRSYHPRHDVSPGPRKLQRGARNEQKQQKINSVAIVQGPNLAGGGDPETVGKNLRK